MMQQTKMVQLASAPKTLKTPRATCSEYPSLLHSTEYIKIVNVTAHIPRHTKSRNPDIQTYIRQAICQNAAFVGPAA